MNFSATCLFLFIYTTKTKDSLALVPFIFGTRRLAVLVLIIQQVIDSNYINSVDFFANYQLLV